MSVFKIYFDIGLDHILSMQGLDHIVFIIILCAIYFVRDWKRILILVTAFTIGHTITLALSTFKLISLNSSLIEFLIPLTIFITAFSNIIQGERSKGKGNVNYVLALFFGFVHGMGFSNSLRGLMSGSDDLIVKLLAFNLGIEVGQIIIVAVFMLISFFAVELINLNRRDWRMTISAMGAGIALLLMFENKFW